MALITLQSTGFDYGHQTILEAANLTINPGERYGLVGVNGAGKTTLIRLIGGGLKPLRGSVQRGGRTSVGYLTQDTTLETDEPLLDGVRRSAFGDLLEIEQRLQRLSEQMGGAENDEKLMKEYGELHERFEAADGYTMESRSEAALQGLGFERSRFDQPLRTLSGGQKRRAALASVLLAPHDVLLLDEPTNHLDLDAREWLEAHLSDRAGALIAISHDRTFLDNTTELTLHLYNARLDRFAGNYTKFQRQWTMQKAQWEEQYQRQKQHIQKTEAFIRKNIAGVRTNQAKSRRKQLDRLDRLEAPPTEGRSYRFDFSPARSSGQVVFEAHGLAQRFGDLELFADLEFQVLKGDKIGIVGPNGTGKTTLLRMLTREAAPSEGVIRWGHNVDVGYYDQSLQLVNDTNTVLGELRSLDGQSSDGALRGLLAAFGFTDDMIEQPVRSLSGGERARLSLLHLIFERHNTVLLDEPTNHLDTDAREAIEASLIDYAGTLICVSHDRYFLNRICDRIFAFERGDAGSDRDMRQVLGNYDDYRRDRQQRRQSTSGTQQQAERDEVSVDDAQDKRQLSKNQRSKIRREIADLEEEIALLEEDIERIGQQMSSGEHAGDSMAQRAQNVAALQETLRGKLERWERLNALMER